MITYPDRLQKIVASRSGIAPTHLLDVVDCNGNMYYWSNRRITAPAVIDAVSLAGGVAIATPTYLPWILSAPSWSFFRSLQTDMGTIALQYLSGDTLSRDFDKLVRRSALDSAFFVYRYWSASAEGALLEVHGTLSPQAPEKGIVQLQCKAATNFSQDATPRYAYSEICPLRYGSAQCGAMGSVECQHSFPTCQVPERILVISNSYEKNFGAADATPSIKMVNRARKF